MLESVVSFDAYLNKCMVNNLYAVMFPIDYLCDSLLQFMANSYVHKVVCSGFLFLRSIIRPIRERKSKTLPVDIMTTSHLKTEITFK
jgi:hypothetical protein